MKIYFDNCALQRPLDDKSQTRIRLEAEAILSILEQCKAGNAEADYFCTCNDRFLRRAKTVSDLKTMIVTPLELIEELDI